MAHRNQNLIWVLIYVVCGMALGIIMTASRSNVHDISLPHILYAGFALSLLYGVIHRLWLFNLHPLTHYPMFFRVFIGLRQAGSLTMFTGLLLLCGEMFLEGRTEPVLTLAAFLVMFGSLPLRDATPKVQYVRVEPNHRKIY